MTHSHLGACKASPLFDTPPGSRPLSLQDTLRGLGSLPVDVDRDAGAPLQYGQSTLLQADTSGPPPTYTHEAYGWLELTRMDQMIDSYLFGCCLAPLQWAATRRLSGPTAWKAAVRSSVDITLRLSTVALPLRPLRWAAATRRLS